MNISDQERAMIQQYLMSEETDIERSIGRILLSDRGLETTSVIDAEALKEYHRYIKEKIQIFKHKICVEWNYQEKLKNVNFIDDIHLVAAIADVIAKEVGIIPVFMVASLLVKKGLSKLCSSNL
ncbi:MAG: hypothetical protein SCK28_10890 [Bacillota bacterium]|nr:hypothetical protein [Bacillota bacterium]